MVVVAGMVAEPTLLGKYKALSYRVVLRLGHRNAA